MTIKNIGTDVARPTTTHIKINGGHMEARPTAAMGPGEQKSVYASFVLAQGQTYTVKAKADAEYWIVELDETNNEGSIEVTI